MPSCTKGHEGRCREARSDPAECECKCGGKNHGRDSPGPRFSQMSVPLRGEHERSKPATPCDRHPLREATTLTPSGVPLCDHCADQFGIEKGDQ